MGFQTIPNDKCSVSSSHASLGHCPLSSESTLPSGIIGPEHWEWSEGMDWSKGQGLLKRNSPHTASGCLLNTYPSAQNEAPLSPSEKLHCAADNTAATVQSAETNGCGVCGPKWGADINHIPSLPSLNKCHRRKGEIATK